MIDVKILVIRDLLVVNKVQYASGVSPRSLDIIGTSFLQAQEVLINDLPAPEFIVLSDSRILAQVPRGQENIPVQKVTVLAESPSPTRSSLLHFDAGKTFGRLQGLEKLIQQFVKLLLQTPGSDKFDPLMGGGVLSLVGRSVNKQDSRALSTVLVGAVARTKSQLVSRQSRDPKIPPDERLLSASTEAVGFNPNTTTLAARIGLSAVSGKDAVANLTF